MAKISVFGVLSINRNMSSYDRITSREGQELTDTRAFWDIKPSAAPISLSSYVSACCSLDVLLLTVCSTPLTGSPSWMIQSRSEITLNLYLSNSLLSNPWKCLAALSL